MHRIRFLYFTGILILLLSSGCSQKPAERSVSFFAMDTYMSIRAYDCPQTLPEELKEEVERLEGLFSVTREGSDIARLNASGSGALSPETRELVEKALALCRETEGALDITLHPLVKEWGFTTGAYQLPAPERIRELLELVDHRQVKLSDEGLQLEPGMALDLGSIAKGFTGDVLAARLREAGVKNALLDLGGNIQTIGPKPDGSLWQIGIRNPEGGDYIGVVSVQDMAVITSGGYERFFTGTDGRTYWHILDPATGYPADSGLKSVTVIGPEGWRCDGLSTALFVMGAEKARAYWMEHGDFELVLLTETGQLIITEGLKDSFQPNAEKSSQIQVWSRD